MGLNISNNVRWNRHMEEIIKKTSTRFYFLRQLKRDITAEKELRYDLYSTYYWIHMSCYPQCIIQAFVRRIRTYPKTRNPNHIPKHSLSGRTKKCNVCPSYERREYLTNKLFEEICSIPTSRNRRMLNFPGGKNWHTKNSFIFSNSSRKIFYFKF